MVRLTLHPHAATPTTAVRRLDVTLFGSADGALCLDFVIDADPHRVAVPAPGTPGFSDGLWRHTCFELFAAAASDAYREFNFAPSMRFAIYDFALYRGGMRPVAPPLTPAIEIAHGGLSARVRLPAELLLLNAVRAVRFGVAAVIEEPGGALSYWSVHHPRPTPDFHDRDGFVVSWPPDADT